MKKNIFIFTLLIAFIPFGYLTHAEEYTEEEFTEESPADAQEEEAIGDVIEDIQTEEPAITEEPQAAEPAVPEVGAEEEELISEEPETVEEKPAPALLRKGKIVSSQMLRSGFLTKEELKMSGVIIKSTEGRLYMHKGDIVFLSFRNPAEVDIGNYFTVYSEGKKVYHPATNKYIGIIVEYLGVVEITDTGNGAVQGRIDVSYKEISRGAKLMPYEDPISEVNITEAEKEVGGIIITGLEDKKELAENDVVYIDKGSNDGVKIGMVLDIYKERKLTKDPLKRKGKLRLPPQTLGSLVIIKTTGNSSTGFITDSLDSIHAGDGVKTKTRVE